MTRSKNNWDHLVDYDGNYLPHPDLDSLAFRQLPMIYVGNLVKAAWPGPDVDTWESDTTGPPKGEIWGYPAGRLDAQPTAGVQSWFRIKINWSNWQGAESIYDSTTETENRLFEMWLPDGRMGLQADVHVVSNTDDQYDWLKVELWQHYFAPYDNNHPLKNLNNNPQDVQVYIRGNSKPWQSRSGELY